eukprot:7077204-Lingulodinium_polyedra.AAC.1
MLVVGHLLNKTVQFLPDLGNPLPLSGWLGYGPPQGMQTCRAGQDWANGSQGGASWSWIQRRVASRC